MNQQQLIFIREIARTGTIRGAAACVDRTPSALTRGLKSVENELGCQLFRRIREGMVPTSEGETVLSYGERILKSLQEIKEKRIWSENEIRYLLCIRENKSITGAAETLFIAQPSLSQVLKEIENDLDFEIFKRDRSGAMETEQGRLFLDQLEEVWKLWKAMKDELGEFKELKKGTVTIGIPMNLGACILPVVVPVFRRRYPGVKVFIRENNSQELEKMMLSLQANCAQVGITMNIRKGPWLTYQEQISNPDSAPNVSTCNITPSVNDAASVMRTLFGSATQGTFENPTWVSTPELDERLDTAVTILDTDERNAAAMELQDYVMAELCASAPVADMANPYAYQSTYIDWPVADYYNETGELKYYALGMDMYMPDISIYTDR